MMLEEEIWSHLAQCKPYKDETKSLPPASSATVSSSIGIHLNSSVESARRGEEEYVSFKSGASGSLGSRAGSGEGVAGLA